MGTTRETPSNGLTTANGAPIADQQALTAGPRGPVLIQDV
jgi:catalase